MLTATQAEPLALDELAALLAALARFETRPFLAVAVSGGPDSLALAILADRWARERGGRICAVTVDHRLRPESSTEIRLLNGWLTARAIRHEIVAWSGNKPVTGIQEAARAARYQLLADWCRAHGCLHLLIAHHREDQAETHLIRRRAGSGADGLAGMSAIREFADCRILRPLLGVAKARLLALLRLEQQPFITDPSNRDPTFERSRLRSGAAVPVGTDFEALLTHIHSLGDARAVHACQGDRLLAQSVMLHPAGFVVLDPSPILSAPQKIAERALAAIIATVGGRLYLARRDQIVRLRAILTAAARRGYTLGGCRFIVWRERILVVRELARLTEPVRLMPGANCLWDRRFKVALPVAAGGPVRIGYLGRAGVAELNRTTPQLRHNSLPRLLYPVLPAVWDEEGIAAVPHLGYRRQGVVVLPQIGFQPINPLTRAAFTVV